MATVVTDRLRSIGSRLWDSSFVRHSFTLGGGNALAQVIVLGSSVFLARLYAPEAFGLFAIYVAVYTLPTIFVTMQYEAMLLLPRRHRQAMCMLIFIMLFCPAAALVLGLPIVLFREQLASLVGAPQLSIWLWLVPFSAIMIGWFQALRYWTMRREAFTDIANNAVVRVSVGAGLAIVLGLWPVFPNFPEFGLIISQLIGEAVGNLLLATRLYKRDRHLLYWPSRRQFLATILRWRHLAVSLTASQGVGKLYGVLPVIAIGWLFGPTATGLYNLAERFTVLPATLISNAIGDVYRQRATADFHRDGRFDKLMRKTVALTTALAVPPYVVGIIIAPFLFSWLFGPNWEQAGVIAQILMVSGLVGFITNPVDEACLIRQKTYYILGYQLARFFLELAAVGIVLLLDSSLYAFIWMIVAVRVSLYSIDIVYNYHLAKGK